MTFYKIENHCRSCGATDLAQVLPFGKTPLADRLLPSAKVDKPELLAPLTLAFCPNCTLIKILETVSPEVLFYEDYPYFSSLSKILLEHFRQSALQIIESRKLGPQSVVIEAASNDGYMLRNFTIYYQHLCYFSVIALDTLFKKHKLFLNDIQRTSVNGGSLRLYVEPHEAVKATTIRSYVKIDIRN